MLEFEACKEVSQKGNVDVKSEAARKNWNLQASAGTCNNGWEPMSVPTAFNLKAVRNWNTSLWTQTHLALESEKMKEVPENLDHLMSMK